MLYTIARSDWSPGHPLTSAEARGGLFRSRLAAEASAPGRPILALALRYDPVRGIVVPQGIDACASVGLWKLAAVVDSRGGITVFGTIPSALIRVAGPVEWRTHPGILSTVPRPHPASAPSRLNPRPGPHWPRPRRNKAPS